MESGALLSPKGEEEEEEEDWLTVPEKCGSQYRSLMFVLKIRGDVMGVDDSN